MHHEFHFSLSKNVVRICCVALSKFITMSVVKPPRKRPSSAMATDINPRTKIRKISKSTVPVGFLTVDKRQFYHMQSMQSYYIKSDEEYLDSGDECEHDVLYEHLNIEAKSELSDAEKAFVNLWNDFVKKIRSFGIQHVLNVCSRFIEAHAHDIIQQGLYGCVLHHFCCLHDGSLLKSTNVAFLVQQMHKHMKIKSFQNVDMSGFNHPPQMQPTKKRSREAEQPKELKPPKRPRMEKVHQTRYSLRSESVTFG